MYYYAELDENDVCIGVFESLEELTDPIYIEIPSLDDSYNGLHYDRTTGTWGEASNIAHSSDEISYRQTDKTLSEYLDEKLFTVNILGDSSI